MILTARDHTFTFPRRPLIMGIINLVADSFSGDGTTDIATALAKAHALVADGADIIDIGVESARTNRAAIPEAEEAAQLIRFIERWESPVPLSINTWRPAVARVVLRRVQPGSCNRGQAMKRNRITLSTHPKPVS